VKLLLGICETGGDKFSAEPPDAQPVSPDRPTRTVTDIKRPKLLCFVFRIGVLRFEFARDSKIRACSPALAFRQDNIKFSVKLAFRLEISIANADHPSAVVGEHGADN
jgi:hypothetical protein